MPVLAERKTVYLGIDPGASGGIVAITVAGSPDYAVTVDTLAMPKTEKDTWQAISSAAGSPRTVAFAVIEQVGGFIGGDGNTGSSMFKFGASYGGLRMALIAAGVPFEAAIPSKWMRSLGIPPRKKGVSRAEWKNYLKARAQQLFPEVGVTLATADALLIAEYCRRLREGKL